MKEPTAYACPICQSPLFRVDKRLVCEHQHSYDIHKKGYVNLLMSQHKQSKAPGDNAQMVQGRREFLRAGHYQGFADAIVSLAQSVKIHSTEFSLLDAGCGEGFYTEALKENLGGEVYGLDISKPAINAAANNKQVHWCVASSHRLPYLDASFDMVVSIFSPIETEQFLRVLKPKGYVLYAGPGEQHLHGLRSIIYDEVKQYSSEKHQEYFGEKFNLVESRSLKLDIALDHNQEIRQLLSMTPHAHRIPRSGYERLDNAHQLRDQGDFKLYLYQKN